MGGRAFHTRGYTAPRLPPKLYTTLSLDLQAKLRTVYPYVVCPPSVLEKPDHGDIDFLVVLDPDRPAVHPGEVADLLGAKDHISSGPHASSYAFVHPIEGGRSIVQVDIKVCSAETLGWETFMASYSDVGMMLAYLVRPLGFKITDKGFHLRIPSDVPGGREGTRFLSHDENEVMDFLGLNPAVFHKGFCAELEVFQFLLSGHVRYGRPDLNGLRKKDKVLVKKRPVFKGFLEGYLTKGREEEEVGKGWTREEAQKRARVWFGLDC